MIAETVTGAASGILFFLLGKLIEWYKTAKEEKRADLQQQAEQHKSEVEQAMTVYRAVIDQLRSDLDKTVAYVEELEVKHRKCQEDSAAVRAENAVLREQIKRLEERVGKLEQSK
jgi:peptidoglycan hydrolase CwlO-like protein